MAQLVGFRLGRLRNLREHYGRFGESPAPLKNPITSRKVILIQDGFDWCKILTETADCWNKYVDWYVYNMDVLTCHTICTCTRFGCDVYLSKRVRYQHGSFKIRNYVQQALKPVFAMFKAGKVKIACTLLRRNSWIELIRVPVQSS